MIKHKKITSVIAIVTMLLISSCKKYTELDNLQRVTETNAFATPENIATTVAGVYYSAALGSYQGSFTAYRGYPFGAASIQQSEVRGEDMVNLAAFYQFTYESTIDANTPNNVNMWVNLYALINQANVMIEGVKGAGSKGIIPATLAAEYEAEGRFLRALSYHELLIHFARPYLDNNGSLPGVPYRDFAINSPAAVEKARSLGRGTVAEDYTKILADLDFAEANLPATRSTNKITRATKAAAIALKTRIKLHQGDWAGVITEGAKLGTGAATAPYTSPVGTYSLTASPDDPFKNFSNNTESIFSIENSVTANPGSNGALAAMFGPSDVGGRGLVATSPNLYNASFWVTGDLRRTLLQTRSTGSDKYVFNYKYRDYTSKKDYAPIIRYAEVLLNVAEAYARTTALDARALSLLNAVRNRSVTNPTQQYTLTNFVTGNDLIQAILNERRVEFAGEGRRWPDIHRLAKDPVFSTGGIPAKILKAQLPASGSSWDELLRPTTAANRAAIPYADKRFIWPIPASEIAANPDLPQNPEW